jgi:hypothetical protein
MLPGDFPKRYAVVTGDVNPVAHPYEKQEAGGGFQCHVLTIDELMTMCNEYIFFSMHIRNDLANCTLGQRSLHRVLVPLMALFLTNRRLHSTAGTLTSTKSSMEGPTTLILRS